MKGKLSGGASRLGRERDRETGRMGRRHAGSRDRSWSRDLAAPCRCTHTHTQMVCAAVPVPRPTRGILSWSAAGSPWPPQAAAQRDEYISLPTGLCPAPLHHLKGAAEVGEGKQEVPPSDPASIETSRYIFMYFFPGCWDEAEMFDS